MMSKPVDLRKFRIHAVTDTALVESADFIDRARVVSSTGLAAINLRAHGLEGRRIYGLAESLRGITAQDGVPLIVNDRLVARGEVLVLNDNFCVRINDIVSKDGEED